MILLLFVLVTFVDRDDLEKGVAYIRSVILEDASMKRCDKRFLQENLDSCFKITWVKMNLVELQGWGQLKEGRASDFSFLLRMYYGYI